MAAPHTSHSLLERARDPANAPSWRKLTDLYTPLIRRWARPYVAQSADVDDVVQDVLAVLVRELPAFEHSKNLGAFRSWLRIVTVNRIRVFWRSRGPTTAGTAVSEKLHQLEDPSSSLSRDWDEEHDRHVLTTLLDVIRLEFQPVTWRAFELNVREGLSASEVAANLGISVNAVLISKSRVMKRLREKSAGLVD